MSAKGDPIGDAIQSILASQRPAMPSMFGTSTTATEAKGLTLTEWEAMASRMLRETRKHNVLFVVADGYDGPILRQPPDPLHGHRFWMSYEDLRQMHEKHPVVLTDERDGFAHFRPATQFDRFLPRVPLPPPYRRERAGDEDDPE